MFAITESTRKVFEKEITTYKREVCSANVLKRKLVPTVFKAVTSVTVAVLISA
jgi:hypothetical protein